MGSRVWAGIGGVVFASSFEAFRPGNEPFRMTAKQVMDAAPFYKGLLVGGVLADETDRLFRER
jgi:hypothetical protein